QRPKRSPVQEQAREAAKTTVGPNLLPRVAAVGGFPDATTVRAGVLDVQIGRVGHNGPGIAADIWRTGFFVLRRSLHADPAKANTRRRRDLKVRSAGIEDTCTVRSDL